MKTKDQVYEYNQAYYKKNKEKLKQDSIDYYYENKEAVLVTVQKYKDNNRELLHTNGKIYYRNNLKNRLLNAARARSKKSGLDFNITIEDFEIPLTCPLLNIDLFVAEGRKSVKYNSASLDRIDSSKGYVKGNVWIISFKANTMKSNSTLDEFTLMANNWNRLTNKELV